VAVETALAVVLLISAGVMMKNFIALQRTETGLDAENVLTLRVTLPTPKYPDRGSKTAFYKQALEKISALPAIKSAAFISFVPMQRWGWNWEFKIEGREPFPAGRAPYAERRAVTPDYFRTMGIPLIEGRFFTEQDNKDSAPVVIINQALARYFPGGKDPVGSKIQIDVFWCTVVGVVKDVRQSGLYQAARPESFRPYGQEEDQGLIQSMSLVAKTGVEPTTLATSIRQQITAVDPAEPIYNVKTMQAVVADSISYSRLNSTLLNIFAGIALLLAMVGIYGVVSYWVAQRSKEIGVRVALGAGRADILKMVVRRGMLPVALGLIVGVPSAAGLTKLLSNLFYLASKMDTIFFIGITGTLAVAALAACLIPATRATRLDPIRALREE
jgi:predicted permease